MNRIKPQQKWLTDIIEGLLPQSLKWLIAQGYVELERDGDLLRIDGACLLERRHAAGDHRVFHQRMNLVAARPDVAEVHVAPGHVLEAGARDRRARRGPRQPARHRRRRSGQMGLRVGRLPQRKLWHLVQSAFARLGRQDRYPYYGSSGILQPITLRTGRGKGTQEDFV